MNAITRQELAELDAPLVSFSLNGREVQGRATESLLQVAKREGVEIPHLCFKEGMEAVGNCRSCMVEINGERVLAPSCCRAPAAGMKVVTDSERAVASQKMVLELLLSDMPEKEYTRNNEVDQWAAKIGVGKPRFEARQQVRQDVSHPAIAVNLDACIQCTPCRVGTAKAAHLMEQPKWDLALLADLSLVMRDASICGLGQAAPNPMDCVVKYFPHELA